MKKISFIAMILTIFVFSTICLSCVNSSESSGASSGPDITGRYEAENGDYYEFDCSDEAKKQIDKMYELMSEGHDSTGHEGPFDGVASYSYTTIKNGGPYFHITLWMPFTIDDTKVIFDDKEHSSVTMSASYDSLTDITGNTYKKTDKEVNLTKGNK